MKEWQLVADSSCDMGAEDIVSKAVDFASVPLKILVGDREFVDLPTTDAKEMLAVMKAYSGASSTSCPSPEAFAEQFRKTANSIAVTITQKLSGTYNCAVQAMNMVLDEFPEKNIYVLDSKCTAGSIVLILRKLVEMIESGLDFDEVVKQINSYRDSMKILFSLASFDNLVKNGRMSRVAGIMASALNIRAVATNNDGEIEVLEKPRGEKKAVERMVTLMEKYNFKAGNPIVLTHCNNKSGADAVCSLIKSTYGVCDEDITVLECACLTSFYAGDKGLLLCF